MMNPSLAVFFEAFAYIGILAVGLRIFGDSFQILFEKWIQTMLRSLSQSALNTFGVGFAVTFFVQSSSVTTLSAMGLSNAGLLSFSQLLSFNLGSYLAGTAIGWFFASYLVLPSTIFLSVGLFLWTLFRTEKVVEVGRTLFGIGLVLFALLQIASFADNLEVNGQSLIFEKSVLWSFIAAGLIAFVSRSALIVLLFIVGLSASPFIDLDIAISGVIGATLGASLANLKEGLRLNRRPRNVAIVLFVSQLAVGLAMLFGLADIGTWTFKNLSSWSLPYLVVLLYMVFQFVVLLVILPFWAPLNRVLGDASKVSQKKQPQRLAIVGGVGTLAPSLAIEQGWQELAKLAAMTETIMTLTRDFLRFSQIKEEEFRRIRKYEKITNNIQSEISEFLRVVTRARLSGGQAQVIRTIVNISDELELISDHCLRLLEMRLGDGWSQDHRLGAEFDKVVKDYEGVFSLLTGESDRLVLKGRESLVEFMKVDGELAAKYHIASIHNSVKNLKS